MRAPWIIGTTAALGATVLALLARTAFRRRQRSNVFIQNGVIHGPGGFRYRLTDQDLLWLARAIWGEADTHRENGAGVAWAMAQYYATVLNRRGGRPAFSTFTALLRAYCQPINPKWASRDASGCRRRPDHCTERHLAKRRRVTGASWSEIPSQVRQLVREFAAGQLPNPVPRMTDWAAHDWSSRSKVPLIFIRTRGLRGNHFGIGKNRRLYRER
jgi:hypothetical protein